MAARPPPIAAYSSCRLKKRKLEPYWEKAHTELAESTITRPSTVRVATENQSTTIIRRAERSARALASTAESIFGPTTRSRGRGVGRASSLRMGPPRIGRSVRNIGWGGVPGPDERVNGVGEPVAPVRVVPEHVHACAARRQQHLASRSGEIERLRHRLLHRGGHANGDGAVEQVD